ncbi:two-component sensor histidine kinase [Lentzea sp. NBRC 105346]|uniref:sensor histidine kinase n=1 Tax=Lentzea sp. NBRC 105346 TaxID=3032205 RepID=UPI0024A3E828|nr:HAMP domain-containing sensor histidine kinase [Lentzea sp. NBRC 105346]GLZ32851.1 two-component sensor histidine kinase [Lentzea sp. NBRC 105346]
MKCGRHLRLGTRLLLGLGALALVVFAIIGTVMVTSMRTYLDDRLDEQMRMAQQTAAEDVRNYDQVTKVPVGWYSVVYKMDGDRITGRSGEIPHDVQELDGVALQALKADYYESVYLRGDGKFRARGCAVSPTRVLVSAAPVGDQDSTVAQLMTVEIIAFLAALITLVVGGQAVLRRGLRPLSDMADTAHHITSHDLTDSARLPVRDDSRGGGTEIEELRTAFNTMLEHIDSSLAARTMAEQRLRRFIADASHELRTPLTSLRGYADLFRYAAANEPAERERHLEKLRSEAARMSVLLDDLLLLARLDSAESEPSLRLEEMDLAPVAEAAADAYRAAHPGNPLTLDADTALLRADPARLRQVLDNLLTNVAVHTPAGTAIVLEVDNSAQSEVVIRVRDDGPGIPREDQTRIFDRFYRVDDSRTRQRGGSGLGLAVVESLVHAHGGTIELTSTPGSTTFTIRLPRRL